MLRGWGGTVNGLLKADFSSVRQRYEKLKRGVKYKKQNNTITSQRLAIR
jgi:hypothetical protein